MHCIRQMKIITFSLCMILQLLVDARSCTLTTFTSLLNFKVKVTWVFVHFSSAFYQRAVLSLEQGFYLFKKYFQILCCLIKRFVKTGLSPTLWCIVFIYMTWYWHLPLLTVAVVEWFSKPGWSGNHNQTSCIPACFTINFEVALLLRQLIDWMIEWFWCLVYNAKCRCIMVMLWSGGDWSLEAVHIHQWRFSHAQKHLQPWSADYISYVSLVHNIVHFLRATAGTAIACLSHRNSVRPSVRPSVCPSHGWIRQKRCKLGSSNLHRRLPQRL